MREERKYKADDVIAEEELNACVGRIQKRIGIKEGDFAAIYFSGISDESRGYEEGVQMLTDYITAEREYRR